jgi:hypothetical protein
VVIGFRKGRRDQSAQRGGIVERRQDLLGEKKPVFGGMPRSEKVSAWLWRAN